MAARLTRAKKRIHDSSIRFAIDDEADVTARFPDALTTLYLLYTVGHAAPDDRRACRCRSMLARDCAPHPVGDAEAAGLLALLLLTEARQIDAAHAGRRVRHAVRGRPRRTGTSR